MSNEVTLTPPPPAEPPKTLRAHLGEILSTGPLWLRGLVLVALILTGAVGHRACQPTPAPAPQIVVIPQTQPAAFGAVEERPHPARTLLRRAYAEHMRHLAVERLQRDGLALVGGDGTPVSKERAEAAARMLSDNVIADAGVAVGAPLDGNGPILTLIRQLVTWVREHPEDALKLLLMLIAPFL